MHSNSYYFSDSSPPVAREKRLEQQCSVLADQYYEQHGRHPPESEDEVDDQDNDELFDLNLTSHLDPEYGEDSENDSGSPIMTLFPTSVRFYSCKLPILTELITVRSALLVSELSHPQLLCANLPVGHLLLNWTIPAVKMQCRQTNW